MVISAASEEWISRPAAINRPDRLPQLYQRYRVVVGPVVTGDGVEFTGAGHEAGSDVAVLQLHQGLQTVVLAGEC